MPLKTLEWTDEGLRLLDQTRLPGEKVWLTIETPVQMWEAIRRLSVRGAPAIGDAAAFGAWLGVRHCPATNSDELLRALNQTADYLATARPTAVNLFWALDRMRRVGQENRALSPEALKSRLLEEARAILDEDLATCRAIGQQALAVIPDRATVLTHCNAGGLATAGYGTALAGVYAAHEAGRSVSVFADETRPLLQGARITAFELQEAGVPVTLICDSMAAVVMRQGRIDLVIVGADRIAANGDTANKIGTYSVALAAREHGVPFYVAAPLSTIDRALPSGDAIPIEERPADEILRPGGVLVAPEGTPVYNPAFDVTPAGLIAGIITEKAIARPPYGESLAALFEDAPA